MRIHIIGGPGSGKTTLAASRDKLIRCRHPPEVEAFFKGLAAGSFSP